MAQPIKYWDTEIDATKSAGEVMALLVRYGASRTSIEWDSFGEPTGIHFVIEDKRRGTLPIRLEARTEDVLRLILKERPFKQGNREDYEARMRSRAAAHSASPQARYRVK